MSESSPQSLAAIVEKPRAEDVLAALREEGCYDADRRVTEHGDDAVALPVTERPQDVSVAAVIERETPRRSRSLEDLLADRGWSSGELAAAPGSWAVVGDVILVRLAEDCPRPKEVGEALLDLHGNARTVLERRSIDGPHREPDVAVLAGSGETATVQREHGVEYALDLSEVMFSPGNKAERRRMGNVVDSDDAVFDMFAGIGYFTLPMAVAGATVTAVERNPTAFEYLRENVERNDVADRVGTYRADCRTVEATADRVVMGHYDAHAYLDHALEALTPGGMLHYHEATPEARLPERPIQRIERATEEVGRAVETTTVHRVKTYSEGVVHVVVDAVVG
jgi:tRNA wybutosine-synthesizing protein 2